jgi:hypothetical protein
MNDQYVIGELSNLWERSRALRTAFSVANRDNGEEPVVARHTIRCVWRRVALTGSGIASQRAASPQVTRLQVRSTGDLLRP